MSKQASRAGKRWADSEVRKLKLLIKQNAPTPLIAWKLFRTESGVESKAVDEGLSIKRANKSSYNCA